MSRQCLAGIFLSAIFGISSAYFALFVGMTPNMALAGTFLGGVLLWKKISDRERASCELNVIETTSTAGNAVAAALGFTLPACWLAAHAAPHHATPNDLTFSFILRAALAAAGGISLAILVTTVLLPAKETLPGFSKPKEAEAVKSLIQSVAESLAERKLLAARFIVTMALIGVVAGIVNSTWKHAYQKDWYCGATTFSSDDIKDPKALSRTISRNLDPINTA